MTKTQKKVKNLKFLYRGWLLQLSWIWFRQELIKIILGLGLRWGQQPWRSNNANSRDPSSSTMKSSRVSRTAPPVAYRAIVNFAHLLHTVVKMNGGLGCASSRIGSTIFRPHYWSRAAACVTHPSSKTSMMKMQAAGWSKCGQFSGSIGWWVGRSVSEGEQSWARLALPRNPFRD